jgi:signal transduction histidine kinase
MGVMVARKFIPDIIICDWEMPVMNGIDAIKNLKQDDLTKDIPIIMATGVMTSPENLNTALTAGAIDYIRKPIDPIELLARINSSLKLAKSYTEIKQKNNKITEQIEKLRLLNATKDKFFTIISHDLRSPFNSILGFSELLIENVKELDIAETENYLEIISSSAKNTLVLLDNLLNWAKSQTGQINFNPKKLNLSSIIQEIIEKSNSMAKIKDISLNQMKSDEIEAYADENMLMIVLRNLISNAIKFTETGGNINISVISVENQVEISISDDGVGMNDETRKQLFDISADKTTKGTANEKGSGLGLILCKEFVEKLGGNIWVESELGKGSDFKFTLPLSKLLNG